MKSQPTRQSPNQSFIKYYILKLSQLLTRLYALGDSKASKKNTNTWKNIYENIKKQIGMIIVYIVKLEVESFGKN